MIASQSPMVATSVRVVSPLAVMLAAFLFFAGHNQPGGGFAAGLVLGSVVALRMLAGLSSPADAISLLAVGAALCAAEAIAPMLFGDVLLDQWIVEVSLAYRLVTGQLVPLQVKRQGRLGSDLGEDGSQNLLPLGERGLDGGTG